MPWVIRNMQVLGPVLNTNGASIFIWVTILPQQVCLSRSQIHLMRKHGINSERNKVAHRLKHTQRRSDKMDQGASFDISIVGIQEGSLLLATAIS